MSAAEDSCKQFGFHTLPEGADPIREDEFERLPDYVADLIQQSSDGTLQNCDPEELKQVTATFFENSVTAVPRIEAVEELSGESKDECASRCDSVASGEVSASE
jgi:hypothetical protein